MFRRRKRVVVWINKIGTLKLAMTALLILLMVFVFTYELPSTKTWTYWTMPLSGKTIAIDAGHGGPDGGAENKEGTLKEKDINLEISKHLRDYLQQAGALVVMTRENDADLADAELKGLSKRKTQDLLRRAQFVTEHKSDLFISIHMNAIPSAKWSGAQTFYYPNNEDNPLLATLIQDEIKRNLQNTQRVAQRVDGEIYLLKTLKIPSALVEVGFLSNAQEARLLADQAYQRKVAASIYEGILRYYSGEKVGTN